ncbi:hypothetical protein SAZ11_03715 [Streptomyces sp. FXJ1.4098]|nr:hypothetical protein [Streptomyces sp. FXJ1.4098]
MPTTQVMSRSASSSRASSASRHFSRYPASCGTPVTRRKLILTYPNDDAVLFGYQQIVDKDGWNYLAQLVKQSPELIRGVPGSAARVASGDHLASVGGDARPNGTRVFSSTERFDSWAQGGAIFKKAPRKARAKLFLSRRLPDHAEERHRHLDLIRPQGLRPARRPRAPGLVPADPLRRPVHSVPEGARAKLIHGVDDPDTGFGSRGGWRQGPRPLIVVPTRTLLSGAAADVRPSSACRAP